MLGFAPRLSGKSRWVWSKSLKWLANSSNTEPNVKIEGEPGCHRNLAFLATPKMTTAPGGPVWVRLLPLSGTCADGKVAPTAGVRAVAFLGAMLSNDPVFAGRVHASGIMS